MKALLIDHHNTLYAIRFTFRILVKQQSVTDIPSHNHVAFHDNEKKQNRVSVSFKRTAGYNTQKPVGNDFVLTEIKTIAVKRPFVNMKIADECRLNVMIVEFVIIMVLVNIKMD